MCVLCVLPQTACRLVTFPGGEYGYPAFGEGRSRVCSAANATKHDSACIKRAIGRGRLFPQVGGDSALHRAGGRGEGEPFWPKKADKLC